VSRGIFYPVWKPDPVQELLLKACIAEDQSTELALRAWEEQSVLDDIDVGSMRLIPYLYRKLERSGIFARDHGRIKGIYARSWYLHNRRAIPAIDIVRSFPENSPPFLLLKGSALQVLVYADDEPTRPADDVDILIRPQDIYTFVELLVQRGFDSNFLYSIEYSELILKSLGLRKGDLELDLNWRVNGYSRDQFVEERIFGRAQVIELRGVQFNTLSSPDHFLHTLLHGSGWNSIPPIRWVLDAALLAQILTESDWNLVVSEVVSCGWRTPILQQLKYLKKTFAVEVPQWVLNQIEDSQISIAGVLMNQAVAQPTRFRRRLHRFAFAEYFSIRSYSGSPHPWISYPMRLPSVWMKIVREFRQARVKYLS